MTKDEANRTLFKETKMNDVNALNETKARLENELDDALVAVICKESELRVAQKRVKELEEELDNLGEPPQAALAYIKQSEGK